MKVALQHTALFFLVLEILRPNLGILNEGCLDLWDICPNYVPDLSLSYWDPHSPKRFMKILPRPTSRSSPLRQTNRPTLTKQIRVILIHTIWCNTDSPTRHSKLSLPQNHSLYPKPGHPLAARSAWPLCPTAPPYWSIWSFTPHWAQRHAIPIIPDRALDRVPTRHWYLSTRLDISNWVTVNWCRQFITHHRGNQPYSRCPLINRPGPSIM